MVPRTVETSTEREFWVSAIWGLEWVEGFEVLQDSAKFHPNPPGA